MLLGMSKSVPLRPKVPDAVLVPVRYNRPVSPCETSLIIAVVDGCSDSGGWGRAEIFGERESAACEGRRLRPGRLD
eukprot:92419-Prorocentrum_minimum.AAC.1